MIKLTRIDGTEIFLNHMNIQWIECIPDTTITVMNGARIIVKEKIEEVLNLIRVELKIEQQLTVASPENYFLNTKFENEEKSSQKT
ncbi:flagellar FlbD family protein [Pigmentibacter sp. JX0631]|uniref:flagellar FlbD family protein n=1 Tax=Pigmentibacter sp. JX0631 TaxID=2976982 RepID=UPI00246941DC|nr:flagellar FlbD family protein [Pigmentibacter sp. JX0631]WGL59890.1 flagellar FlbD family protein [Pigmentibacter sp. JX0631]